MADIVEEVIEDVEGVFKPRPGGMVDLHRQNKARREEAARERENSDERQEEHGYKSVKVTSLSPEVVASNTVVIPANGVGMVLPNSPYRCRATIISSVPVILAKDASAALGGVGYPLAASTPFLYGARAQLWAFSTSTATVSTLAELYAPEV
jgi:hypothetical protein